MTSGDHPVTPDRQLHPVKDRMSVHDTEDIGWFRSVYEKREAFSYFPIGFQLGAYEIGLTLGHQDKNYKTHAIGTDDFKQSCKFHTDAT